MSQQVNVKIELEGGKQLTHCSSLRITQKLFKHHKFEIKIPFEVLEKEDEHFFKSSHETVCGKKITVSFDSEYVDSKQDRFKYVFKGVVTEISLRNKGDLTNTFIISGYSPDILLEDVCTKRTFLDKTLNDIFSDVLNSYPSNLLKKSLNPQNSSPIKYTVQYNETNFEFLRRLAAEYGEWFYYDGEQLLLGKPSAPADATFAIDGAQTFDMSISLQPSKVKFGAYDYKQDATYDADATLHEDAGLNMFGKFALDESDKLFSQNSYLLATKPIFSQSDLTQYAKVKSSVAASELITFEGSGEWPNISVGTVVTVKGSLPEKGGRSSEQDFGKYLVTEITHKVDSSGNYSNYFTAVPESVNFPPRNPYVEHPIGQTELAKVIDNKDPDNLGRVKVEFAWPGDASKESDWIPVGTFYAGSGDSRGMLFVPDIDAQVFIDYELNHAEYPFVSTSIYSNRGGVRKIADKNNEKYIYTQSGNQIVFYDSDDNKSKIEITNENKTDTIISISFEDKGKISIKTSGLVEVEAQEDISMKATKKITLEGENIEIKATNSLTCTGTQKATLKGSEIKIEADTNATMKANAQAKISSSLTEVSADGIMTVKGSLVKIN
jgi:type VI secretion system secreted protein VgrG